MMDRFKKFDLTAKVAAKTKGYIYDGSQGGIVFSLYRYVLFLKWQMLWFGLKPMDKIKVEFAQLAPECQKHFVQGMVENLKKINVTASKNKWSETICFLTMANMMSMKVNRKFIDIIDLSKGYATLQAEFVKNKTNERGK
jgi:hypothetical protein